MKYLVRSLTLRKQRGKISIDDYLLLRPYSSSACLPPKSGQRTCLSMSWRNDGMQSARHTEGTKEAG